MTKYAPTVSIKTDAFGKFLKETVNCCVGTDGTIFVWDNVAGHFTRRHAMNPHAAGRVRAAYLRLHQEYWMGRRVVRSQCSGRVTAVNKNLTVDITWDDGDVTNESFETVGWTLGTPGSGASDEY
jgi:hypothetical protein